MRGQSGESEMHYRQIVQVDSQNNVFAMGLCDTT